MIKRGTPTDYSAQWAEPEDAELTLPSGKKVLARQPDLAMLAERGTIPDNLLPIVEKFIFDKTAIADLDPARDVEPGKKLEGYAEFYRYLDAFCVASIVAPRFSFDGRPNTIKISKLDSADKVHVWSWATGRAGEVAAFPDDPSGTVDAVPAASDSADLRDAAESTTGVDQAA